MFILVRDKGTGRELVYNKYAKLWQSPEQQLIEDHVFKSMSEFFYLVRGAWTDTYFDCVIFGNKTSKNQRDLELVPIEKITTYKRLP